MDDIETNEDPVAPKITAFEYFYLFLVMALAVAVSSFGLYLIMTSTDELPTGPSLMVVGSLMSGITIIKFAAERKKALNPIKLHKAVFGKETMIGVVISTIGILWYLIF